jgi:hypothetical protein
MKLHVPAESKIPTCPAKAVASNIFSVDFSCRDS